MISAHNVSLQFGGRPLFEHVDVQFTNGNCYGLIGANGTGKSTFLKILSGELEPNKGEIVVTPGERIAVLVVAAVTGSLAGLVVARVSIGTLVAGDGHVQVPPVRMVLAGWPVAGGVVALVLVLLLVSVPIVRRGVSRVAADLREGGV